MGLTIHYSVSSSTRSATKAKALVEQMRQLALDLPFESVDDHVRHLGPEVCQRPLEDLRDDESLLHTVWDGCESIPSPWQRKQQVNVTVQPLEVFSFRALPGLGSEWAGFGLARYPAEVEVLYSPRDDDRFLCAITDDGCTRWEFDWKRWRKWLRDQGENGYPEEERFQEHRVVKTRLGARWCYSAFCKTQYASDPRCGGLANFIKSHLCVVHLLDRIAQLPTVRVEMNDEGQYGRSRYTDDPSADQPVSTWHEGKYDVNALVEEVGKWNEMIAAGFGALRDALKAQGFTGEASIAGFPNFEHLEFKGQERVGPFLDAMKRLVEEERAKAEPETE